MDSKASVRTPVVFKNIQVYDSDHSKDGNVDAWGEQIAFGDKDGNRIGHIQPWYSANGVAGLYIQSDQGFPTHIDGINIQDLKKSVSDGKSSIASAITNAGVATNSDATFATIAQNIVDMATLKYNAGVTFGDGRPNMNSTNYKVGYSNGFRDGKRLSKSYVVCHEDTVVSSSASTSSQDASTSVAIGFDKIGYYLIIYFPDVTDNGILKNHSLETYASSFGQDDNITIHGNNILCVHRVYVPSTSVVGKISVTAMANSTRRGCARVRYLVLRIDDPT